MQVSRGELRSEESLCRSAEISRRERPPGYAPRSHLVDEVHAGHDLGLPLFSPLGDFLIDLLAHLHLDLAWTTDARFMNEVECRP